MQEWQVPSLETSVSSDWKLCLLKRIAVTASICRTEAIKTSEQEIPVKEPADLSTVCEELLLLSTLRMYWQPLELYQILNLILSLLKVLFNLNKTQKVWDEVILYYLYYIWVWPATSENSSALKLGSLSVLWLTKQCSVGQWTIRELLAWRRRLSRNLRGEIQTRCECRLIYRKENKKAQAKIEQKVAEKDKQYLHERLICMCIHSRPIWYIFVNRYTGQEMTCTPVCIKGCDGLHSTCVLWPCLLQQDTLHQPCDVYIDVAGEALQAGSIGCYSHQKLRRTGYLLGGLVVIGHSHDDPGETVNQRH